MLPPNARWKVFVRFGLIRFRSISSHGTDWTSARVIAQKAPLHSQMPIPTGSIRQKGARRQYIARSRAWFPCWATSRDPHRALGLTVKRPGRSICHRDSAHKSSSRNRISHIRALEQGVWPTGDINGSSLQHQRPQSESSQDYYSQLPKNGTLHSPATTHALLNGFRTTGILKEATQDIFGNRTEQSRNHEIMALKRNGSSPAIVPICPRSRPWGARRKPFTRKLHRPLTIKGFRSYGLVNHPTSICTLHQVSPHRKRLHPVVTSKDQRRSIHVVSRPSRKPTKSVKKPPRANSTEEHSGLSIRLGQSRCGNVPPIVAAKSIVNAETAEPPSKHATRDFVLVDNRDEIRRQHILTREILEWLRDSELRSRKDENSSHISLNKCPAAQLAVVNGAPPPTPRHVHRQETSLTSPSSEAVSPPFVLPSPREQSIHFDGTNTHITSLPVDHIFEHPTLLESGLKAGDPVKCNITPEHRPTNVLAAGLRTPMFFALHKTAPMLAPAPALPVIDRPEVMYGDILEGLQLGLAALLDSDVDFWVKEALGTSARRFLADISALSDLKPRASMSSGALQWNTSLLHSPPVPARHPAPCVRVFQSGVMARTRDVEEPGQHGERGEAGGWMGFEMGMIGDGLRAAAVWSVRCYGLVGALCAAVLLGRGVWDGIVNCIEGMQIIINGTRGIRGRERSRHGGFLAVYTCIDEQQSVFELPPASSSVLRNEIKIPALAIEPMRK
ncbi:hypothetical protein V490_03222 [Pseudogymnoascus sp. VKM F-3557]|nr:hypothetical protein V490_03222 [Pseudogymnoascus sp. VKM F-3557]